MKLYSYQEELVNSKSDRILISWCRGAGKTIGIIEYILTNKIKNVLIDNFEFHDIKRALEKYKEQGLDVTFEQTYIRIENNGLFTTINKEVSPFKQRSSEYDLYVFGGICMDGESNLDFKKVIKVMTGNIYDYYFNNNKELYHTTVVDYKDSLKENAISLDSVISAALNWEKDKFFEQYALKDMNKEVPMRFDTFKDQAVQRLQKQFLDTNDSKDTVLTRKNIIEMIKDLKGIN